MTAELPKEVVSRLRTAEEEDVVLSPRGTEQHLPHHALRSPPAFKKKDGDG